MVMFDAEGVILFTFKVGLLIRESDVSRVKINVVLFSLVLCLFSGAAAAQQLRTTFGGWIGKQQRSEYIDGSDWHYCFSNRGGSCGAVALTTGHNTCVTRGFNIGLKWSVPTRVGSMEINGGYNQSWSACNVRQETVTCSPKPGWKGRAAIIFSERVGRVNVVGGDPDYYVTLESSCPAGWKSNWEGGYGWSCRYNGGTYSRHGYLPEWRGSTCDYERI
jgi:hypothetical protein